MEKEEIIDYLKDNLEVLVEVNYTYYQDDQRVVVKLSLDGKVISEGSDVISVRGCDV